MKDLFRLVRARETRTRDIGRVRFFKDEDMKILIN